VLEYPGVESTTDADLRHPSVTFAKASPRTSHDVQLAFVGAGNYALQVLMPAFRNAGANLRTVVSRGGSSGAHAASKFGFAQATTDVQAVLADSTINAVVIATRHDSHADIVCRALAAGKNVFVEKPLALSQAQLDQVERAYRVAMSPVLTVGFNRRFAPQVTKIKELLSQVRAPKAFVMTVNAGTLPAGHWTVDPEVGGGRLVGEACHFVDLLRFLAAAPITLWRTTRLSRSSDCATIAVGFSDGSIGSIHYLTNGSKAFPKERLEVFAAGRVLQLDNFRKLTGYGWPGFSANRLWRQDKGQADCARAFVTAVKTGALPVPIDELLEVSRVSIRISEPDTET
jgi:predicted dehydrogenase